MTFLFNIGFLPISLWDVLDVGIVGYLLYRIYLLLRGSIAFNIFVGVVMLYLVWWAVGRLEMGMLYSILGQFVNVGFIIVIIIFQPEVRRFLLLLGSSTMSGRSNVFGKWLAKNLRFGDPNPANLQEIKSAILRMSLEETGALIVFSKNLNLEAIGHSGVLLDAQISQPLLLSIFQKESPLHDGAVIIGKGRALAASRILPVSESASLPDWVGLRHRAAVGISERTSAVAFVISETTGGISFAGNGQMESFITEARLDELLHEHLS